MQLFRQTHAHRAATDTHTHKVENEKKRERGEHSSQRMHYGDFSYFFFLDLINK